MHRNLEEFNKNHFQKNLQHNRIHTSTHFFLYQRYYCVRLFCLYAIMCSFLFRPLVLIDLVYQFIGDSITFIVEYSTIDLFHISIDYSFIDFINKEFINWQIIAYKSSWHSSKYLTSQGHRRFFFGESLALHFVKNGLTRVRWAAFAKVSKGVLTLIFTCNVFTCTIKITFSYFFIIVILSKKEYDPLWYNAYWYIRSICLLFIDAIPTRSQSSSTIFLVSNHVIRKNLHLDRLEIWLIKGMKRRKCSIVNFIENLTAWGGYSRDLRLSKHVAVNVDWVIFVNPKDTRQVSTIIL